MLRSNVASIGAAESESKTSLATLTLRSSRASIGATSSERSDSGATPSAVPSVRRGSVLYDESMIYLGADRHGLKAISFVADFLRSKNVEFANLGVQEEGRDIKLEELIPKIAVEVLKNKNNTGIMSCGTGVGVEVGANKLSGIRACLAQDDKVAEYARVYDDCNVLCLVGWEAEKEKISSIVSAWLKTDYVGDEARSRMFDAFDAWGGKL